MTPAAREVLRVLANGGGGTIKIFIQQFCENGIKITRFWGSHQDISDTSCSVTSVNVGIFQDQS